MRKVGRFTLILMPNLGLLVPILAYTGLVACRNLDGLRKLKPCTHEVIIDY